MGLVIQLKEYFYNFDIYQDIDQDMGRLVYFYY